MRKAGLWLLLFSLGALLFMLVSYGYSEAQFRNTGLPYVPILEDGHGYAPLWVLLFLATPTSFVVGGLFWLIGSWRERRTSQRSTSHESR